MFQSWVSADAVASEVAQISLGDRRLNARAQAIVRGIARAPAKSIPSIFRSSAEREGFYRFCQNDDVSLEGLLRPHVDETLKRIAAQPVVRVVHDTTRNEFMGNREGLATLSKETRGFFAHCSLAVGATELREPLGVLGLRTYVNDDEGMRARRKLTRSQKDQHWKKTPREEKARHRWESAALEAAAKLPPECRAIHVMDQEADDFHVFYALLESNRSFVIRGAATRLTEDKTPLQKVLDAQPFEAFRRVRVSRRPKATKKMRNEPRDEREASLSIRYAQIELRRPNSVDEGAIPFPSLPLNVVHVFEANPPDGEQRIEWVLFTSEPVPTFESALEIVDHYRARWLIEEFFKALKTGCSFEKRQLTTYDGLTRFLGLIVPIAWQLLRVRHLARQPEPLPAAHVVSADQLQLLRALLLDARCDYQLPQMPNARDVLLAIAALGGHIRNNGDPGWLVLWRGYDEFLTATRGWDAARRSDQS